MSKYNLIDLFEGMSNDEFEAAKEADRLEAHPNRDKIKAIQALLAKEKANKGMSNDEFEAAKEADRLEAHPNRDKIKAIQALLAKEKANKGVKEMTGGNYNRIDGLTNQVLLQQFLLKFSEIYEDMVEAGDMFDVSDVIQYLTSQMQEFANDTRMDQGGMMESTGPSDKSEPEDDVDNVDTLASPDAKGRGYDSAVKATSDQDNEEERDDAGVPPMYTENKDDFMARHGKADITLKKGYKHHTEDELTKLYYKIGELTKDTKIKKVDVVFEVGGEIKERDEARNKMYDLKRQKESMSSDDREMYKLKNHFGRFMKDFQ